MQIHRTKCELTALFAAALLGLLSLHAQEKAPVPTVPVRMTVTVQGVGENKHMPDIKPGDVVVRQGQERLQVTGWVPARGDHAGLDLFFLIDDASDPSLGSQLNDLRTFINAQPATTSVGVGYMRNTTVQIAQNFTTEHDQAAKALRLPMGSVGAFGSPYLSLMDLMRRWPEGPNRREVVMITDGIDRARRGLSVLIPDVDSAGDLAQRTGTIIHTIYARGVGRLGRNFWEQQNGVNGTSKLSDVSGGVSFFLSFHNAVSFKPYLEELQKILDNQYILSFEAIPGKKSGLQRINLTTEVAGVEFTAADAVWVPAAD
jgi:hypothetical protein